ncbi:translation initiation factor [Candidatus Woesearchaeota archaeon]|nr:translation initiation factor [Candidatus Woesearchaeota archaeon]
MSEICTTCGLPKELCVCETIAKEAQKIVISSVKKKFGKIYTIVEGINNKDISVKDITKNLKSSLACGGTFKDNRIELQGNHMQNVLDALVKMGFAPETIEIRR